jgi:hypothetical protein
VQNHNIHPSLPPPSGETESNVYARLTANAPGLWKSQCRIVDLHRTRLLAKALEGDDSLIFDIV